MKQPGTFNESNQVTSAIEPSRTAAASDTEQTVTWQAFRFVGDILQFCAITVVLGMLLFADTSVSLTVQLLTTAVLLWGALRWGGWVVLVAIQVSLFFREPGGSQMNPGWEAFLYCVISLLIIALVSHSPSIRRQASRWFANQMTMLVCQQSLQDQSSGRSESTNQALENDPADRILYPMQWMVLLGTVLLAILLMRWLPITSSLRLQWLERSVANAYMLWPGASLVVLVIGLLVTVREAAWRQMTTGQARLYLCCSFVLGHFPDLKMVVLRRQKFNRSRTQQGKLKR